MKRLWNILLSMTFMLLLVPAVAFADDGDLGSPVSISFNAAVAPQYYEGQTEEYLDINKPGNSVTVTYKNGSKVYKFVEFEKEEGYSCGWFLNGDTFPDEIYPTAILKEGKAVISVDVYDTPNDTWKTFECTVAAKLCPYPVSLAYTGADLIYEKGDTWLDGFYTEGNKVTITYSDNITKTYIYTKATNKNGEVYIDYCLDGKPEFDKDGYLTNSAYFDLKIPVGGFMSGTNSVEVTYSEWYYDRDKVARVSLPVKEHVIPIPVSLAYTGADLTYVKGDIRLEAFYTEGNKVTITYNDNSTKTYIYTKTTNKNGEDYSDYYLDGKPETDEDGYYFNGLDFNINIPEGGLKSGTTSVDLIYSEWCYGEEKVVKYSLPVKERVIPYPVSLSYSGSDLGYHIGGYDVDGFFDVGNKVTVTYSDGSSEIYICKAFENNDGYEEREYFLDGKVVQDETNVFLYEWFDIDIPDGGIKAGTTSLDFSCKYWIQDLQEEKVAKGKLPVKELPKPKSAKLSGKLYQSYVGQKDLFLGEVAKPGNKIVITYTDGTKETYKCIKYKDGKYEVIGFFLNGDEKQEGLWGSAYIKKGLKKGKNTVKFELSFGDYNGIPLKVAVRAKKLYASVKYRSYVYTGKKITPKIVVKDGNGKTVPAKAYTVKYYNSKTKKYVKKPVGIKWGNYEYKVVFKKAYRNKYIDTVWGDYGIGPKGTTVTKVTPGSKKITVKWKKQTGIDGYFIQYSRYKDFGEFHEKEVNSKNKTSAVLKDNLKSKKTYYVRVVTYKKYKGMWVGSEPSKAKKVKVK